MGSRGRYGFWFPLVLLGFLMFGGIVLATWPSTNDLTNFGPYSDGVRGTGLGTGGVDGLTVTMVATSSGRTTTTMFPGDYWIAGVFAALLGTVAWYAWGSSRWRVFAWVAVCGVIAVAGSFLVMEIVAAQPDLRPTIGGSLIALGLCAAAWGYFRLGPGRTAVTAISAVCLPIGIAALLPAPSDELVMVIGLLILAWWERSWLLAAVAIVFLVVAWVFLPGMAGLVLAAAVLLGGGVAALVLRRTPAAEPA